MICFNRFRCFVLLSLLCSPVTAQDLPANLDPASPARDLQERERRLNDRQVRPSAEDAREEQKSADKTDRQATSFVLKRVRLNRSDVLSGSELIAIVQPYLDTRVTLADLEEITRQIDDAYRARNVYTARAILPEQDVTDGTVVIRLIEGKLGNVLIEGNDYIADDDVRRWIAQDGNETLTGIDGLEGDIQRFNRINDARLQAELRAGEEFGLTDIVIRVDEPEQNHIQVYTDNYGYESTGEYEIGGIYRRRGLFTGSDRALVFAQASEGSQAFSLSYNSAIGASGWRLGGSLSLNETEVTAGDFEAVSVEGDSRTLTLDSSWLAVSEPRFWLSALGSLSRSESGTTVIGADISDYEIDRLNTGLEFTWLGAGWQWTARQLLGRVQTTNKLVDDADQSFWLLTGDSTLFYQSAFPDWYGLVQMDYQYTNETSLPGAVSYSLGGATSVRGYEPGVVSGDYGFGASIEAHYVGWRPYGTSLDSFAFFDIGRVYSRNPGQTPQAAGLGFRWTAPGGFSLSITHAQALEQVVPDQSDWMTYGRLSWQWSGT